MDSDDERPKLRVVEAVTLAEIPITPNILAEVCSMATEGLSKEIICSLYGVSVAAFDEACSQSPELKEAYEVGVIEGLSEIVKAIYRKAKEGDVEAAKFILASRDPDNWIA